MNSILKQEKLNIDVALIRREANKMRKGLI